MGYLRLSLVTPVNLQMRKERTPNPRESALPCTAQVGSKSREKYFRGQHPCPTPPLVNHMDAWYAQAYNPAQIEGRKNEHQVWEL